VNEKHFSLEQWAVILDQNDRAKFRRAIYPGAPVGIAIGPNPSAAELQEIKESNEERAIAMTGLMALRAFREGDADSLIRLAHPELKTRLRTATLLTFFLNQNRKNVDVSHLSDDEVVRLFCEAHRAIVPHNGGVYFDDYVGKMISGQYAILAFNSGWLSTPSSQAYGSKTEVVLKNNGGAWLFLWSAGVSIHVDLNWDPRRQVPGWRPP